MRQFITIAANAFLELVRQPVFLLLATCSVAFIVFLANVPYFGFGEDARLVKDGALAVMLLAGLLGAVLCASHALTREIHSGTALAVLSKPVGRATFLLAKYAGLAAALAVLNYLNSLATLLASRMAYDAYNDVDYRSVAIFAGGLLAAYLIAAFTNYFLHRPFVPDALFALGVMLTVAFLIIYLRPRPTVFADDPSNVDWRLLPATLLILFALWILAALALASSTRLDLIATLAVCSTFFLLGLVSDYLFGQRAEQGSWWAKAVYALLPNWQLFWMADALGTNKTIPWSYLTKAFGYSAAYIGAALAVGLCLFQERELS